MQIEADHYQINRLFKPSSAIIMMEIKYPFTLFRRNTRPLRMKITIRSYFIAPNVQFYWSAKVLSCSKSKVVGSSLKITNTIPDRSIYNSYVNAKTS